VKITNSQEFINTFIIRACYKGVKMDQVLRALERIIEELSELLFK
jgi:hypothetical protein